MIQISSPFYNHPAFAYTIDYVFTQIWGMKYKLQNSEKFTIESGDYKIEFFQKSWNDFVLPDTHRIENGLVFFQKSEQDYDYFYYLFLILSRYEEFISTELDAHGRFSFKNSFLTQELIQRPIVDEYVDHLKEILIRELRLNPELFKVPEFKTQVTFDVDMPRNPAFQNYFTFIKGLLKGRVTLKDIKLLGDTENFEQDSYFNFEKIFSSLQKKHHGHVFIISGHTHNLDGTYKLKDKSLQWLIDHAKSLDMVIGVHGSYNSFKNSEILKNEKENLEAATDLPVKDIRQHFLRFDISSTLGQQAKAGLKKDWSMGYAEMVGFRAGTCRPYKPYDHVAKSSLELIEEPLIVMDATLASPRYMNLKTSEAMSKVSRTLFDECKKRQGHFNILFHNVHLMEPEVHSFYTEVLSW